MKAKALLLTKGALELLKAELTHHSQGRASAIPLAQLLICERQLKEMIFELEEGPLRPSSLRLRGMGTMIADSWPLDSELGDALLLAEQAYRKAT